MIVRHIANIANLNSVLRVLCNDLNAGHLHRMICYSHFHDLVECTARIINVNESRHRRRGIKMRYLRVSALQRKLNKKKKAKGVRRKGKIVFLLSIFLAGFHFKKPTYSNRAS